MNLSPGSPLAATSLWESRTIILSSSDLWTKMLWTAEESAATMAKPLPTKPKTHSIILLLRIHHSSILRLRTNPSRSLYIKWVLPIVCSNRVPQAATWATRRLVNFAKTVAILFENVLENREIAFVMRGMEWLLSGMDWASKPNRRLEYEWKWPTQNQ